MPHALLVVAARTPVASATASAAAVATGTILLRRTRRGVLRPLDELLGSDHRAVLVLRDELEADPATGLVDLLDDDIDDVAAAHHVFDMRDPARADVRDVEEAVGALLELDERAELRRLHDLAGERVADLRLLRDRLDCSDRGGSLLAVGRVDEDRAVLLDVDLHLVVGFEATNRLAALADDHADLLLVDLDRRDPRRVRSELGTRLGDDREHRIEDL